MTVFVYVNTAKQVGDKDHIRSSPRSMPPPRRGGVTNLSHAAHYEAQLRCFVCSGHRSSDDPLHMPQRQQG